MQLLNIIGYRSLDLISSCSYASGVQPFLQADQIYFILFNRVRPGAWRGGSKIKTFEINHEWAEFSL